MRLPFVKYHGAGNDFVLMDFYHQVPCPDLSALARSVCDRRHGIGADGLLLLFPSTVADFQMRIFNADGSEAAMCGNGIRCLASYILKSRNICSEIAIETLHAVLKCRKLEDQIAVNMGPPTKVHWPIDLEGQSAYVVDTGVPSAVIFVDALDQVDVANEGRRLRFDPRFAPGGVNVTFASTMHDGRVAVRIYERGVEAETLACGTGAAAAAFVAKEVKHLTSPISVLTRTSFEPSQMGYHQKLRFFFSESDEGNCAIEMVGPAEEVFEGSFLTAPLSLIKMH